MFESLGKLVLYLLGDATSYTRMLRQATVDFNRTTSTIKSLGKTLITDVVAPLTAIGSATAKLSMDFSRTMANIEGLVGVARKQVDAWKTDVKGISIEFGKMPQDVANAMFFITSAGLRGKNALEALEISAKGSAAGLGTASQMALAMVSAMNAYQSSGLTAAKAGDILAATIRKGNLEINQLAPIIGRLLPIASSMGLAFEDVGGAIAVLTLTGSKAAEAQIGIQGILKAFAKPAKHAVDALAAVGLNFQQLRDMIRKPGGIIEAIRLIDEAMEREGETGEIAQIFGDIRPLKASMNILAQAPGMVDQVMKEVRESSKGIGVLGEAFEAVAKEPGFKFDQMMSQIKVTMISIGDVVSRFVLPWIDKVRTTLNDFTVGFDVFQFPKEIVQLFSIVRTKATELWEEIKTIALDSWKTILDTLGVDWEGLQSDFKSGINIIAAALNALNVKKVVDFFKDLVTTIKDFIATNAKVLVTIGLVVTGLAILYNAVKVGMVLFTIASAGYSAAVTIATAATWLWNAALVVMNALLAPVTLGLIIVGIAVIATTILVAAAAAVSAWKALQALVDVLFEFPTTFGPIRRIKYLLEEWVDVIRDIKRAAESDLPLAWKIMKKGFELALSEMKDLWPPLWEFIQGGFDVLWKLVSTQFKAHMARAILEFVKEHGAALAALFGTRFEGIEESIAVALEKSVEKAKKELRDLADTFEENVKVSRETVKLREELDKLRESIKDVKEAGKGSIGLPWSSDKDEVVGPDIPKVKRNTELVAATINETIKNEVKPLESVLFGSAEARSRIAEYAALLRQDILPDKPKMGTNPLLLEKFHPASVSVAGFGGSATNSKLDEILAELKKANENVNKSVEVLPMNLKK
jgi:TP901 family phage tail tape measure protein